MRASNTRLLRQRIRVVWNSLRKQALAQGLAGQLLRGGIGSAMLKILSLAFTFVVTVFLARALGAQEFGLYSFVLALVTIMSVPPQFGLPGLVIRETARSLANEDYGRLIGSWRWSSRATFLMSFGVVALGFAAIPILGSAVPALQSTTYSWGLLLVPLLALGAVRSAALRGLGKVVQGLLPELVLIPALLMVLVGMLWLIRPSSLSAASAMAAHAIAAGIAFLVGIALLYRSRPPALRERIKPFYDSVTWRNSAIPMAIIMGVGILFRHTDTVMLGLMTTEEHVGIYRVASQWAWLVTFGGQVVNFVIPPFIARFYAQGDKRRLQMIATRAGVVGTLLGLPPLVAFVLFGKRIIALVFGPTYTDAYIPLVILSVGQFLNVLTGSCGTLLAMTNFERDSAKVIGASVFANIGLNALFIPLWGPAGAAAAGSLTLIAQKTILWRVVRLRLGIEPTAFGRPAL